MGQVMPVNDRLKYRGGNFAEILLRKISAESAHLKELLKSYPAYRPPYAELADLLSDSQAEECFNFFQAHRMRRLHVVTELLEKFHIALDPTRPDKESLSALDNWAYQQWPAVYSKHLARFPFSSFAHEGEALAIRSMLFDISVLLGECYLAIDSNASWCIDTSPVSAEKQLPSWHRIVINLDRLPIQQQAWPNVLDIEDHVYFHYSAQEKPATFIDADWKLGTVLAEPVLKLLRSTQAASQA